MDFDLGSSRIPSFRAPSYFVEPAYTVAAPLLKSVIGAVPNSVNGGVKTGHRAEQKSATVAPA